MVSTVINSSMILPAVETTALSETVNYFRCTDWSRTNALYQFGSNVLTSVSSGAVWCLTLLAQNHFDASIASLVTGLATPLLVGGVLGALVAGDVDKQGMVYKTVHFIHRALDKCAQVAGVLAYVAMMYWGAPLLGWASVGLALQTTGLVLTLNAERKRELLANATSYVRTLSGQKDPINQEIKPYYHLLTMFDELNKEGENEAERSQLISSIEYVEGHENDKVKDKTLMDSAMRITFAVEKMSDENKKRKAIEQFYQTVKTQRV